MKKIIDKKGFTLVECIVAMAVLAIMSLLLTMMLTVALKIHNRNMTVEQDIDKQIANIASNNNKSEENNNNSIQFNQGGAVIDSIPSDGTDNLEAKKDTFNGSEVNMGILDYDFSKYTGWSSGGGETTVYCTECKKNYKLSELIENGTKCPFGHILVKEQNIEKDKVRGAIDTDKIKIHVEKDTSKTDTYNLTITIDTLNSASTEKALKITLPATIEKIDAPTAKTEDFRAYMITKNAVRIEPKKTGTNLSYTFSFTITDANYAKDFVNVSKYFTGVGDSNDVYMYRVAGTERFSPNPQ
ncbi:MAG: prepilin-type N-terminal cleavage/methylation domain-containing protein [Ruminococcaceae bacterium]|nr:prepilin-type N-terminal cleavage/methylation domain-containing protein [Oscillospiraceae bacterium]